MRSGGVKEVAITGERVVVDRRRDPATGISRDGHQACVWQRRDQDIEWAYMKGQIYIVQSRPFIAGWLNGIALVF